MGSTRVAQAVVAVFTIGVLLNVVQFLPIEREVSQNWQAINPYGTSALDRYPHAERRYGFFVALGDVAPGATMIVPPPRPPTPTRLESFRPRIYGLGRMAELERRDYDPLELADRIGEPPPRHVVAEGLYERNDGRYRIAVADGPVQALVFVLVDEYDLLAIDTRLLPAAVREELDL